MSDNVDKTLFVELDGKMQRLMDGIDSVKEKQDVMADDIAKIKEAVYNPDEGLYARIRELEGYKLKVEELSHPDHGIYARLKQMEAWKASTSKIMWMIITSLIGLATATLWSTIISS
tara:strand:- start:12 stop:362 length:351 start_codon:yes stop_codon:yes gene_type:complete